MGFGIFWIRNCDRGLSSCNAIYKNPSAFHILCFASATIVLVFATRVAMMIFYTQLLAGSCSLRPTRWAVPGSSAQPCWALPKASYPAWSQKSLVPFKSVKFCDHVWSGCQNPEIRLGRSNHSLFNEKHLKTYRVPLFFIKPLRKH